MYNITNDNFISAEEIQGNYRRAGSRSVRRRRCVDMMKLAIPPLPKKREGEEIDRLVMETVAEWKQRAAAWRPVRADNRLARREAAVKNGEASAAR